MGTIPRREGVDWPLIVVGRGPQAEHIRLTPVLSSPNWLAVELEPTRYMPERGLSLTRLKIRIPPGSEPSTHLGGQRGKPGRISLAVEPPSLGNVTIEVRFAVSE